jgi:hypothetical protein
MKKNAILLTAVLISAFSCALFSQDADTVKYWTTNGAFSVNISQSTFTNWAAGGQNSIALNGLALLTANYKKGKSAWDNTLTLGYGKMKQKDNEVEWVKTDDRIDLQSKYGYQASEVWYYSALLGFKSQFDAGYNYPNVTDKISDFLAPGYLVFSIGMDYKPNTVFTAFISPLTAKTTFVMNDELSAQGAFGVEPGKSIRSEFGAYANISFKKEEIVKNVNLVSRLDLFSNYLHNPQNIDVSWEILAVLKVNNWLAATITTSLLYDDDVLIKVGEGPEGEPVLGKRTQFKEVIGVGLTLKFPKQ